MHAPPDVQLSLPIGFPTPQDRRVALALKAVVESRWADAHRHLESITGSGSCLESWKLLLEGEIASRRGELAAADVALIRAASLWLSHSIERKDVVDVEAMRLAATSLERVGLIRRRAERLDSAARAHKLAFALRAEHGSGQEQWESALSLALDLELAGRFVEAADWGRRALAAADEAGDAALGRKAIASGQLSRALAGAGDFRAAALAAREALELCRDHDAASPAVPVAQMRFGQAMLRLGERLLEKGEPTAEGALTEADENLRSASEALLAFGPPCRGEAARCGRLLDFSERLLAMVKSL